MKKILLSIATIALVATVAVKATGAFFTDTKTNPGNTFTTGTLTLLIDGTDSNNSRISGPFFNVTNMKPGDTKTAYVEIKNNGSMGMYFRTYVDNVTDTGNLDSQLKVSITLNPTGYEKFLGGTLYGPANEPIKTDVVLDTLEGVGNAMTNHLALPMPGGHVAVYKVDVTLPTGTTSDYQNKTFTGDIHVDATQSENNAGPNPSYL